jgi:ribonuclease HI
MNSVIIYTDGACLGNPGPGGWAAVLSYGEHQKGLSGRFRQTTNNRMELRAAVEALNALKRPCRVDLYTDSVYLRSGITQWVHKWQRNGWKTASKDPVKNQDLWMALMDAVERHEVKWHWTKGHAGDELNERADELATGEARKVSGADPVDEESSPISSGTTPSLFRPHKE